MIEFSSFFTLTCTAGNRLVHCLCSFVLVVIKSIHFHVYNRLFFTVYVQLYWLTDGFQPTPVGAFLTYQEPGSIDELKTLNLSSVNSAYYLISTERIRYLPYPFLMPAFLFCKLFQMFPKFLINFFSCPFHLFTQNK